MRELGIHSTGEKLLIFTEARDALDGVPLLTDEVMRRVEGVVQNKATRVYGSS